MEEKLENVIFNNFLISIPGNSGLGNLHFRKIFCFGATPALAILPQDMQLCLILFNNNNIVPAAFD